MPSTDPKARMRLCLLICSLASTPAWTGCLGLRTPPAPTPPPVLQVQIPPTIAAACPRPDRTGVRTVGDLADYAIAASADLKVCDGYRAAAVEIVRAQDAASASLAKALARPWWKVW